MQRRKLWKPYYVFKILHESLATNSENRFALTMSLKEFRYYEQTYWGPMAMLYKPHTYFYKNPLTDVFVAYVQELLDRPSFSEALCRAATARPCL